MQGSGGQLPSTYNTSSSSNIMPSNSTKTSGTHRLGVIIKEPQGSDKKAADPRKCLDPDILSESI